MDISIKIELKELPVPTTLRTQGGLRSRVLIEYVKEEDLVALADKFKADLIAAARIRREYMDKKETK